MNEQNIYPYNFTVAEDDVIEQYNHIAQDFFKNILDMNYEDCLVTDESSLSDFSSCGMPYDNKKYDNLGELYDAWEVFILEKINNHYNIELDNIHILLIHLFDMIKQSEIKH